MEDLTAPAMTVLIWSRRGILLRSVASPLPTTGHLHFAGTTFREGDHCYADIMIMTFSSLVDGLS